MLLQQLQQQRIVRGANSTAVTFELLLLTVLFQRAHDSRVFVQPHFRARGKEWIEIAGCGMVDPNVFKAVGYPDDEYTGWAFGFGIERLAMIMWSINDIRLFTENDVRFLEQF